MVNVFLISLDGVRPDFLRCYNKFANASTPAIDAFAKMSVRFSECFSQAPFTTVSHASMLTGAYPFHHGVRHLEGEKLSYNTPMIHERLKKIKPFNSVGVVSGGHLTHIGIDRGFDKFIYPGTIKDTVGGRGDYPPAMTVIDEMINGYDPRTNNFIFAHLFDAHVNSHDENDQAAYVEQIEAIDTAFGKFFDWVMSVVFKQHITSLVIVTADHGMKWIGDHGFPNFNFKGNMVTPDTGHGPELYNEILRVPLLIFGAGIPPRQHDNAVSIIDIAPTILDYIGDVTEPEIKMDGQSLLPIIYNKEQSRNFGLDTVFKRTIYAETYTAETLLGGLPVPPFVSVQYGDYKLIVTDTKKGDNWERFKPHEMYNIKEDPHELKNILDIDIDVMQNLMDRLCKLRKEDVINRVDYSVEEEAIIHKRLQDMGYL